MRPISPKCLRDHGRHYVILMGAALYLSLGYPVEFKWDHSWEKAYQEGGIKTHGRGHAKHGLPHGTEEGLWPIRH
jgi:hypothetical protein